MGHIFISYSKKNSDYAFALAVFLQDKGFNIWIDRIGIEYGVDWWDAIVDGLNNCSAFIVVMTPESRQSSWVKREVFLALQKLDHKKAIFPLLLDGDNWELFVTTQFADVRDGSLPDGNFLKRVAQHVTPKGKGVNQSSLTPEKQAVQPSTSSVPRFDMVQAIADFGRAFRAQKWSEAINILGRIRASGEDPRPFNPDDFEQKVQAAIAEEQHQREQAEHETECQRLYGRVQTMAEYADATTMWAELQTVWQICPDYDPDDIAARVRPQHADSLLHEGDRVRAENRPPQRARAIATADAVRAIIGDPFEWCDVTVGEFIYGTGETQQRLTLPAFAIAKYPITYNQFQVFVNEQEGLNDRRWWEGLAGLSPIQPPQQKWQISDHPRENVRWYDAIAFCRWLSWRLGGPYDLEQVGEWPVRLPTEYEWEKAARGTEGRVYPYGNTFYSDKSNTFRWHRIFSNSTTPVTRYPQGASPYGVLDMSGNVSEWCLTAYDYPVVKAEDENMSSDSSRVIRGGSWFRGPDHARAVVRYYKLSPDFKNEEIGFRVMRP
ncbi:SUMF1/EgtB/PvdO family nonheme iron enzyme [Phototrophicus methaneseepsis]|uniref:SUMF1/EgtB/PvdO family nonheme iron enzyme n=1 Tax=Phototrophicus methaneseepsis TaxID=2710758 RepID=A0A7S8IGW1_9CHLR|nr:SUMF1/EgtB/PvdO family nonheme iron enzyme [Phototrophicus methaneseepsis]QPC84538.1 SUMF1/EgtB/PvdO family nonheme iron enzyme [Phototrophicus methaneseepsis]